MIINCKEIREKEIDTCCRYGFSVNLLIDNIECVMEDILCGEEITEEQVGYLKTRIAMVRQYEKSFKEILGIE